MKNNDIQSLGVLDDNGNCVGVVDTFDIMAHTVFAYSFEDRQSVARQIENYDFSKVTIAFIIKEQLANKPLKKFYFSPQEKLESLMEKLSYELHRVLVTSLDWQQRMEYKILTQWDVVRFLWTYMNRFDREVLNKTVKELNLKNPREHLFPVWCINSDESALHGFKLMYYHKVNAIAVVDSKGVLEGNLSASDLRGITGDALPLLQLPVMEFLKKAKSKPKELITCDVNHRFKEVMTRVMLHKVHRAWIVDATRRPVGVITLTDIIRTLLEYNPKGEAM